MAEMKAADKSVCSVVGNRLIVARMSVITKDGLAAAQAFQAQTDDVFISTYPKTGTTWLQQICHQLRTGGHLDFDEISEEQIVPWLELSPSLGIDIALPQVAHPRCFKTHQTLSSLSHLEGNKVKYLCTVRDPEKTLLSLFKFEAQHGHPATAARDINVWIRSSFVIGPEGEGDFEPQFGGTLWDFYAEYWKCKNLPNVKVLVFEKMLKDFDRSLSEVADFLGLPDLTTELREHVTKVCSKEWMEQHDNLFDDHFIGVRLSKKRKLDDSARPSFNAVKKVGLELKRDDLNIAISDESRDLLAKLWRERLQPITGHATYAEMASAL